MSSPTQSDKTVEQILTEKLFKKRQYRNGYMSEQDTAYAFDYKREKYVTKYLKQAIAALTAREERLQLRLLDRLEKAMLYGDFTPEVVEAVAAERQRLTSHGKD